MTRVRENFPRAAAKFIALVLPLAWAAALVGRWGVDVPYTDQWVGEYSLFEKMDRGTLGIRDFFAQHNEHRIFFPRLIFYGLDRMTHWNVRAELWVILGLAGVVAFNIWRTLSATGWRCAGTGFWLLLAANTLIFSPLHRENFLWGFQIGFLLPVACMTACLWVAQTESVPARFAGTFALSVVCSFSIGGGFLCWLFSSPLLVQAGGRNTWKLQGYWWLAWVSGFAGSVALYLHGYATPAVSSAGRWAFLHDPVLAARYGLTYLGLPFAFGTTLDPFMVSPVSAAVMLGVLAGTMAYLWRWREDAALLKRCLPWLVLTAIALAYAGLTTVGRVQMGLWQALTSRYVIFAILFPIGTSVVTATIYQHLRMRKPAGNSTRWTGACLVALGVSFALLHLLGAFKIASGWREFSFSLLKSKALVETAGIVDEPELLARLVLNSALRPKILLLDKLGYLRPPLVQSNFIDQIADAANPVTEANGKLEQVVRGPDHNLGMRGWAVLPGKDRPADTVLLTCDDPGGSGRSIIFALAEAVAPRADVAAARKNPVLLSCGWQKIFKSDRLPTGAGTLKAWSFDAETGRAYRLSGEAEIPR